MRPICACIPSNSDKPKLMNIKAGKIMKFLILWTCERFTAVILWPVAGSWPSKEIETVIFKNAKLAGFFEVSKINSVLTNKLTHQLLRVLVFVLFASMLQILVGTLVTLTSRLPSSKGKNMIRHAMLFANCHLKQICHLTLVHALKSQPMAWMMHHEDGGTE